MLDNNFEDFLSGIYTPLKTVELLSNAIYIKYNEDWDFGSINRIQGEKLLALVFAIKCCARYLLSVRKDHVNNLCDK